MKKVEDNCFSCPYRFEDKNKFCFDCPNNITLNKEEKKIEKIIVDNMKNELKHLDWFYSEKPKAFNRTINNMLLELDELKKLYKV